MRARFWGLFASAIVAMPSSEAVVPSSETLDLGEAPLPSERARRDAGRALAPASANDGFRVDVSRREQVRNFYNTVFVSSEGIDEGWTGTYDGCVEGTTTAEFKDAVLRRINYYRAMAGLPAGVVWDAGYSAKAQKAALIMSAQNGLSHFPPATWACYTTEGSEAAANSNIALGNSGPSAIDGYMEDHGAGNKPVGHRRWLLYPQTRVMGTGDVPGGGGRRPANAVWVFDGKFGTSRPETREAYVAWPPPGFVPYSQVFPRWSLSYPGADFSAASVTLSSNGVPLTVALEPLETRVGEPTLVWYVSGTDTGVPIAPEPPAADVRYSVEVQGVRAEGQTLRFSYTVVAFDPAVPGVDSVVPTVAGATRISTGVASTYTFDAVPDADGYEWRQASLESGTVVEGAETSLAGFTARTTGGYAVVVNTPVASGTKAFHMAHPSPPAMQALAYDRAFLVGVSAELRFKSRLGWASPRQFATVQVSFDEGESWVEVYSQAGTGGAGEAVYAARSVALGSRAGRTAHFRFVYDYRGNGTYFPQTDAGIGWYVDDVEFRGMQRLGDTSAPAPVSGGRGFDFVPPAAGAYLLQARALVFGGYPLDWGPALAVEASGAVPATLTWVGAPRLEGTLLSLDFRVAGGTAPGRFELLRRDASTWTWSPVAGATLQVLSAGRDYRYTIDTAGAEAGFFRVRGF